MTLVWGAKPDVADQTTWLGSTRESGAQQNKLVRVLLKTDPHPCLAVVRVTKQIKAHAASKTGGHEDSVADLHALAMCNAYRHIALYKALE